MKEAIEQSLRETPEAIRQELAGWIKQAQSERPGDMERKILQESSRTWEQFQELVREVERTIRT